MSEQPKMMLMPAARGTCAMCATAHEDHLAHNQTSLFYQMRFNAKYGRWPTWADAVAHLPERQQQAWMTGMKKRGVEWTEPPDGVSAIAEPYAISGSHLGD